MMEDQTLLPPYATIMMDPPDAVHQEEEQEEEVLPEEGAAQQQEDDDRPSFVHTTLIHCPPTKVDLIGREQIKDYLPRTIEEPRCFSDQFYRRVLKMKCTELESLASPSNTTTTERRLDSSNDSSNSCANTRFYTYPDYPSDEELSLEMKPHQILDLGRWVERSDFEEHLLKDFVCESFAKSLFEEFVNVLPILTTWKPRYMEACDPTTLDEHDEEQYHEDGRKHFDDSSSFQRTTNKIIVEDRSNNENKDALQGLSNTRDDFASCIRRKRSDSDTASTVALFDSLNSEATSRTFEDTLASSSISKPLLSPDDSFQAALLQFLSKSDSDEIPDETERQAAATSSQPTNSSPSCGGPCCAWKQHCSKYWIKYGMKFVVTRQRTLKPNIPSSRRQRLLRAMRNVALEKYGLTSFKNVKTTDTTTTSKKDLSGCLRYELLESDYHETSDDVLEIVTWRSSYDYEMQQYNIKHKMHHKQMVIQNIDSYFEGDQDNICYWETLICE